MFKAVGNEHRRKFATLIDARHRDRHPDLGTFDACSFQPIRSEPSEMPMSFATCGFGPRISPLFTSAGCVPDQRYRALLADPGAAGAPASSKEAFLAARMRRSSPQT